jgi:peroxiredoxin
LFSRWGFNKYNWSEGLALLAAYSIYVYAGFEHPTDWRGWVLPIFPMLFMTMIGSNIVKDGKRINQEGGSKIKAEAGQPAINFSLPDNQGGSISLSDFKNKNHVLLLFVRGDWCPTCHIMIRTYEKNREKFAEKNVVTIGISPDTSEVNAEMIRRLGLKNILLTDSSQEVTRQYGGKFFANGIDSKYPDGIPLPASVLVDKGGIIRYVSTPGKANDFLDPSHIFPIVAALN